MKIVIATGGFDPIHSGHIKYLNAAKNLGDMLVVGVNSDEWLTRKKGKPFLNYEERRVIVNNLKSVDFVVKFDDSDNSAKDAILEIRKMSPSAHLIFANGGDRTKENIPEMDIVDDKLEFVFGVGGEDKQNSSSWILNNWKA
jgi:cytidyltransferase-like protein